MGRILFVLLSELKEKKMFDCRLSRHVLFCFVFHSSQRFKILKREKIVKVSIQNKKH